MISTYYRCILALCFVIHVYPLFSQNVGINSTGASPAPSSVLDIVSTTKGILIPRMTTTQRTSIGSPASGLMVFDTTIGAFYYYSGSAWTPLLDSNLGWEQDGNTGTTAGTDYVGTTDAVDLVLKTNGSERMRLASTGYIGFNVAAPGYVIDAADNRANDVVAEFFNDGNNSNRWGIDVMCGSDNGGGTNYFFDAYDGNGTYEGSLIVNGGTFQLYNNSDRELKYEIQNSKGSGLNIINNLRLVDYKWKKNAERVKFGLIAQEVQDVYPEMVLRSHAGTLGVLPGMLVPVLVKAVQEQQKQIDAFTGGVDKLSKKDLQMIEIYNKIEALEQKVQALSIENNRLKVQFTTQVSDENIKSSLRENNGTKQHAPVTIERSHKSTSHHNKNR